ncbi:hypothetical protein NPIL_94171 [Nephila pilipes]|uniref:Uncharacterized protein n=1 Tax=Nephila pilipes TaxID=299642 RepID=A0A8X6P257_NEPPI|nr:hypothetical protein NPIL_94171 [Nephila pilipes]
MLKPRFIDSRRISQPRASSEPPRFITIIKLLRQYHGSLISPPVHRSPPISAVHPSNRRVLFEFRRPPPEHPSSTARIIIITRSTPYRRVSYVLDHAPFADQTNRSGLKPPVRR